MTTELTIATITLALSALIVTATGLLMRHRDQARRAGREAESLNVLSNLTRRAFWYSAADHSDISDSSSSDDGGDSGD